MNTGFKFDDTFVQRFKRTSRSRTPILFFHSFDANGEMCHQGYIHTLRSDGTGVAQLFEWFMGAPSSELAFTAAFLRECVFYTTDHAMQRAYDAYCRRERRVAA